MLYKLYDYERIIYSVHNLAVKAIVSVVYFFFKKSVDENEKKFLKFINSVPSSFDYGEFIIENLSIAEDNRFFFHNGVDVFSIFRVLIKLKFLYGHGGSTIEQQLVRTITNYREKSIKRKLVEICVSHFICSKFDKNYIANAYLNFAYFGKGVTGFNNACDFLMIDREALDRKSALFVMALLKYPIGNRGWRDRALARASYLIERV